MAPTDQTLSVVLTVHNAERTLAQQVSSLLDVLPDLAARFELLIVDDGSTDQTEEVAHELARDYPQLNVARHAQRMGTEAAAQTALERTRGSVVILRESDVPAESDATEPIWQMRHAEPNPAQPPAPAHHAVWSTPRSDVSPANRANDAPLMLLPFGQSIMTTSDSTSSGRMTAASTPPATVKRSSTPLGSGTLARLVAHLIAQRKAPE